MSRYQYIQRNHAIAIPVVQSYSPTHVANPWLSKSGQNNYQSGSYQNPTNNDGTTTSSYTCQTTDTGGKTTNADGTITTKNADGSTFTTTSQGKWLSSTPANSPTTVGGTSVINRDGISVNTGEFNTNNKGVAYNAGNVTQAPTNASATTSGQTRVETIDQFLARIEGKIVKFFSNAEGELYGVIVDAQG